VSASAVPSDRSQALEATDEGATLVLAPEVLLELRLALVADLRSVGGELLAIIAEPKSALSGDVLEVVQKRRRWREVTAAIATRHELHEIAGWPGEPPAQRTLTGHEHCALAVEVLARRRETLVARLTRGDLDPKQAASIDETVRLLGVFLRGAPSNPRRVAEAPCCPSSGQVESCQH
jgi:hypothetical protein